MVLGSRVLNRIIWSTFKKPRPIAISSCSFSAGKASHLAFSNGHSGHGQRQVRDGSSLTSKVQSTRYPGPLPFSEIQQAIFKSLEPKNDEQRSSDDKVPSTDTNSTTLARSIRSRRIDQVRAGLLHMSPRYVDTLLNIQIGAVVKDLGSGGPLEVRQRLLRTYNAVITRLLSQDHKLTPYMALQGLKYAQSARSSQAVELYLGRIKTEMFSFDPDEMVGILAIFYERIITDSCPAQVLRQLLDTLNIQNVPQVEHKSLMSAKRLSKILGAFRLRIEAGSSARLGAAWPILSSLLQNELEHVLIDHSSKFPVECWASIIDDILLVARHSGADDALYNSWLMFKASPLMSLVKPRARPVFTKSSLAIKPKSMTEIRIRGKLRKSWQFTPRIPQRIIHLLVQYLIDLGQPLQAWKVVQESNASLELLSQATWSVLLDYPQDLPAWDDSMQHVMFAKYEELLLRIENAMGLEWQGGEDGWHATTEGQSSDESFFDASKADDLSRINQERNSQPISEEY